MSEYPYVDWSFGNYVSKYKFQAGMSACIRGDTINSEHLNNDFAPKDTCNEIESFQWCKNQGLLWYTLKNGDTYRLVNFPNASQ